MDSLPSDDASYALPIRQASALLSASFRCHLAMMILAVQLVFPLTGHTEVFHLLVLRPAGRTIKKPLPVGEVLIV